MLKIEKLQYLHTVMCVGPWDPVDHWKFGKSVWRWQNQDGGWPLSCKSKNDIISATVLPKSV